MSDRGRVIQKKVNTRTGDFFLCCYSDCDRDGVELHKLRVRNAAPGSWELLGVQEFITYVFCSEGHKQLFADSATPDGKGHDGRLLSGNRSTTRYV
jgi:hypothetical protein